MDLVVIYKNLDKKEVEEHVKQVLQATQLDFEVSLEDTTKWVMETKSVTFDRKRAWDAGLKIMYS